MSAPPRVEVVGATLDALKALAAYRASEIGAEVGFGTLLNAIKRPDLPHHKVVHSLQVIKGFMAC
jgi:hypothetical protein